MKIGQGSPKLQEGAWTQEYEDAKFLVRHMSYLPFQRMVQRLQSPHAKKINAGRLDPKISRAIMHEAMSHELVVDWKGVTDNDGKEIPFDPALLKDQMEMDPGLSDFIAAFADDLENYRAEGLAEAGKPSSSGSSGGSSGETS